MVVRVHHRVGIIRVTEPQRVPEFVQGHAEQVRIRADVPALGVVEMHIARDRAPDSAGAG